MAGCVGCLLDASEVSAAARDLVSRLGVTAVFIRGAMALPALRSKTPVAAVDGRVPGFALTNDDAVLRAAIEAVRLAGADPYLVISNPLVGRAQWSDLLAEDNGTRPADRIVPDAPPLCPNRPKLIKWLTLAAADAARVYKPVGFLLEDFSLGSPANLDTLFLCWCDQCQARAGELGYEADRIRIALQGARSKLAEPRAELAALGDFGIGQFIEAIGYDTGLLDWLNFRADSLSSCLYEVRQAIGGADRAIRVALSARAPSVAILVGQRRADALRDATLADFHVPVIGGAGSGVLAAIAAHAKAAPHASEADALAFAAQLHGYGGIAMPASADELVRSPGAELAAASAARELALAMAGAGAVPQWPAIDVAGLPAAVVTEIAARVGDSGAEGLTYIGVPR